METTVGDSSVDRQEDGRQRPMRYRRYAPVFVGLGLGMFVASQQIQFEILQIITGGLGILMFVGGFLARRDTTPGAPKPTKRAEFDASTADTDSVVPKSVSVRVSHTTRNAARHPAWLRRVRMTDVLIVVLFVAGSALMLSRLPTFTGQTVAISRVDLAHPGADMLVEGADIFDSEVVRIDWQLAATRGMAILIVGIAACCVFRVSLRTWFSGLYWLRENLQSVCLLAYLLGSIFIVARVPCSWAVGITQRGVQRFDSDYFWLWDVKGNAVDVTTILLEDTGLLISIAFIFTLAQLFSRRTGSTQSVTE